jgi:hypothetical protein
VHIGGNETQESPDGRNVRAGGQRPRRGGRVGYEGDIAIDGVPGTAAAVPLMFEGLPCPGLPALTKIG